MHGGYEGVEMSKKTMKEIKITADTWSKLKDIRERIVCKKWSAAIQLLLDQSVSEEGTVPDLQEPDHEKILRDIIGDETWSQIQELMSSHNFDLHGISRHLFDCHRLLE